MTPDQLKKLATIVGTSDLLSDPADCWTYGYDNSRRQQAPDAVAFPRNHEAVCQLVSFCNQENIPLTPRGRGTGTTGASVPIRRGLVMSMERMDRILDIDPANRTMTVEPGVINKAVQDCAGHNMGYSGRQIRRALHFVRLVVIWPIILRGRAP